MTLTGPDVSHHQGTVDMKAVHDQGHHAFVGIKASEGSTYLDPMFRTNRTHAAAAGLIRLLYHFGRPGPDATDVDARAEAAWFVRMIGTLDAGEVAVLDLEDDKVPAGKDLTGWMLTFLATVDHLTGRAGGSVDDDTELYTYGPYARGHIRLRSTDRHLWLAAYSSSPSVPPPWHDWTFWQYTSSGSCPGITGRCDLNRFTGPLDALQRIAAITTVAPSDQEALLMSAAKDDDDARRALVRQWCLDQWGGEPTVDEHNILAYNFGLNGADDTLAHIADHAHAVAFRQKRGW